MDTEENKTTSIGRFNPQDFRGLSVETVKLLIAHDERCQARQCAITSKTTPVEDLATAMVDGYTPTISDEELAIELREASRSSADDRRWGELPLDTTKRWIEVAKRAKELLS